MDFVDWGGGGGGGAAQTSAELKCVWLEMCCKEQVLRWTKLSSLDTLSYAIWCIKLSLGPKKLAA